MSNLFSKSSGVVNQRLVNEFKEVLKRYQIINPTDSYTFNAGIDIDDCHSVGDLYKLIHGKEANVTYLEDGWLTSYIEDDGVLDGGPSHSSGSISHQQELEDFVKKFLLKFVIKGLQLENCSLFE